MSASLSLPGLLEAWRQQTLAETQAIRARDWPQVRACQEAKQQLRTLLQRIVTAQEAGARDLTLGLADELLELERANREWLAAQTAVLRARWQELEGAARNLKRVRSSYVHPEHGGWQCYS